MAALARSVRSPMEKETVIHPVRQSANNEVNAQKQIGGAQFMQATLQRGHGAGGHRCEPTDELTAQGFVWRRPRSAMSCSAASNKLSLVGVELDTGTHKTWGRTSSRSGQGKHLRERLFETCVRPTQHQPSAARVFTGQTVATASKPCSKQPDGTGLYQDECFRT
jgi:hypothetical protein